MGKAGEYIQFMDTFTLAADVLGFTEGKKNLGHSEERTWPEKTLSALFRWLSRHRVKRAKIDRIPMKDFLARCHQPGGREAVLVPAAASFREPCYIWHFHLGS